MGLKATIASAVGSAFTALDDIPESVTYRRTTVGYNPQTGDDTPTDADITVDVVFTRYQQFEVDRVMILSTDVKAIVQQSDMGVVVPASDTDSVIRANGQTFNVLRFSEDPAAATFSMQLRAP